MRLRKTEGELAYENEFRWKLEESNNCNNANIQPQYMNY